MNKKRKHELMRWLKKQRKSVQFWIRLSILLGLLGAGLLILQAGLLAKLLESLILYRIQANLLIKDFILMIITSALRAIIYWGRERISFISGMKVRERIRKIVLDKVEKLGPSWVKSKMTGSWTTIILEQVENMQDYYSRYLPQIYLSTFIPLLILIAIFPINWIIGLILLISTPVILLFMTLVGIGAAEKNRRNFLSLSRLSGKFYDSLRGLDTLRLFYRAQVETDQIITKSDQFRRRTMGVLRLAFLSSAVLEFVAAIAISIVSVYFSFSYIGVLDFSRHHTDVTVFSGFLVLILAPEFFQPLRNLGTFYHAKAKALGAADSLVTFLSSEEEKNINTGTKKLSGNSQITIIANQLEIISSNGTRLAGPLNFSVVSGQRIAIVGHCGAGKSSLLYLLLGFLPYRGSITINEIELRELDFTAWRQQISWVGQNPSLPAQTLAENILLDKSNANKAQIQQAIKRAYVDEFLTDLPNGLKTEIGDQASRLSVGQAQRVAVARALLNPCRLLLLDEPSANLDINSAHRIISALILASHSQTTLLVTHQLENTIDYDQIWVMENGLLIQKGDYMTLSQTTGTFSHLLRCRGKTIE